jgi:ribonuclease VapC
MILDTSAIIAAIAGEPDHARFQDAMLDAEALAMSASTALETRIVLYSRYGEAAVADFDEMLKSADIVVVPFDDALARAAFDGFRRYGKGQGRPAQLNIVDCAAYALAKTRNEPLLFKGNDFLNTDVESAL